MRFVSDKNATPGDKGSTLSTCLDHLRPHTMCVDRSAASSTDPDSMRTGAFQRFEPQADKEQRAMDRIGDLKIDVRGSEILQFHSKYVSQVLPFVIPRMVSGPDFFPHCRWRRAENDPWVSPMEFSSGFSRRVEASCRKDWNALPIIRSLASST